MYCMEISNEKPKDLEQTTKTLKTISSDKSNVHMKKDEHRFKKLLLRKKKRIWEPTCRDHQLIITQSLKSTEYPNYKLRSSKNTMQHCNKDFKKLKRSNSNPNNLPIMFLGQVSGRNKHSTRKTKRYCNKA